MSLLYQIFNSYISYELNKMRAKTPAIADRGHGKGDNAVFILPDAGGK
jgi:hypothetical protein